MITITISRKLIFLATAMAAGFTMVATAVAVWQTGGIGTVYGKAGSAAPLTLGDASVSTTADLYPGASGGVKVRITNPNSFPVRVTTVARRAGASITSDKGAACNASTGIAFADQTSLALDLAANETQTFTLANAVSMSNASDNSCQGAVFSVPVDVTAVSNAS